MKGYICVDYGFEVTDKDLQIFKKILEKRYINKIISMELIKRNYIDSIELYYNVKDSIQVSSDFDFIKREIIKEYDDNADMFKVSFSYFVN